MSRTTFLPLLAMAMLSLGVASAASTQVWEISERKDFLLGTFDGVALDADGRLLPAPELEKFYMSDETAVWSVAPAPDGDLFVGTGHQGRVYRVNRKGKAKLVWDSGELEVFALAAAEDGTLYAGTSPNGKIYRVKPNGDAEAVFDPKQEYIWSLAFAGEDLYVGTGPAGKIFRVGADGTGEEWFDTGQRHVTSLALDSEGRLLAGTDPNGVLFRVESKGKAFTLYDSDLPEIRSIVVAADGAVWFAALGGSISLSDQTTQAVTAAATFRVTATAQGTGSGLAPAPATALTPVIAAAAPVQPIVSYGIETAAVFRLRPELAVDKLWSSKQENVLGLIADPRQPGRLLFLTDQSSRLYQLDADGRSMLLNQAPGRRVTGLAAIGGGAWVTTIDAGGLLRLKASPPERGTYRTGVRDAGGVSQWGRLSWKGAGTVRFQTRTGNAARPDKTWSDWSDAIESAASGGLVTSPPARYIQWRATLVGGGTAPLIEQVRVAYLPQNRPPTIAAITVSSAAATATSASAAGGAGAQTAAYSITVSAVADGSTSTLATSTQERKLSGGGDAKLEIAWTATDPDDDALTATVEFRGDDETTWKLIERDVTESKVQIERDALADGRYRFRVRVSDARANPAETAKSAERISAPVLLDRTPPLVRLEELTGRVSARFTAEDAASALSGAEYSIDAGPWQPVFSSDRLLDSREEEFVIDLSSLEAGEKLLTLRVRDSAGNVGLAKAVLP